MNITKISRLKFFCALFALVSLIVFLAQNDTHTKRTQAIVTSSQGEHGLDQDIARSINAKLYQRPFSAESSDLTKPSSLAGIYYDVSHLIDEQGQLIPSRDIRHMFDSYLSALNETDLENIIGLIQLEISNAFAEPARSDALSLLRRYLDYKIGLIDFEASLATADSDGLARIIESQKALKEFRATFFSTHEYEGFFEEDDAHNDFMIVQMRINQDPSLSDEEKAHQLEQALGLLPATSIQSRKRMLSFNKIRAQVQEIRESGGTEEAVFAARAQAFGAQAALDLQTLDTQRWEWQRKLDIFSDSRSKVLQSSMTDTDKQSAIEALIHEQFDPREYKRVAALMNDGRLD